MDVTPGSKPSRTTVRPTVPCPTSSMSEATLERDSFRQVSATTSGFGCGPVPSTSRG